jgi:hypothetical protein
MPDLPATLITDSDSFLRLTGRDEGVAGLYAYSQLDRLVELACLVARDFFTRPHLYTKLSDPEMAERLARLQSRVGHHEYYPSAEQRHAMYEPVFGGGDFARLREGMLTAAAAFAEWSQATGIPMLRERVRTAHRPFREYLRGVSGASIGWSRSKALPSLADREAYPVLRDTGVIAVFGLTLTPNDAWPYREDSNGDKVVEEISRQLEPMPDRRLTREGFSSIQRVALRGAEALTAVMTFSEDQDDEQLDHLTTRCYTWHAALMAAASPITPGTWNGNS